jgi:phenylacetate-CoA ligase
MLLRLAERLEDVAIRRAPVAAAKFMGAVPAAAFERMQLAMFKRTLRLAAEHSAFYRDAFARLGVDPYRIAHPSELGEFFTTGDDLRRFGPSAFLTGRADTAFETTGTTSPEPKRVYFSTRELNNMGAASAAALYLLGLRRDDVVLSAFDCSFWVSPAVARSAFQYIGCFHVEAGKIDPLECYQRALAYAPTVITGEPSWLVRFSAIARERGIWPVKMLLAGGENMAEVARTTVERTWNGAPLYLNYGQTEAFGSIGLECRMKRGYHRNDLHFLFEIRCPDSDGYGELVYTTLTRDVMPLIRYRASDITRLEDTPCPCGLFAHRLAPIRSRSDEMVVCGMGNVGPWVFDEILRGVEGAGAEWQVVLGHNGAFDTLELRIEAAEDARPRLDAAVRAHLRERFPDFWKNLAMGLYELETTAVPAGTLRQGRKLRRIVDQRPMTTPVV